MSHPSASPPGRRTPAPAGAYALNSTHTLTYILLIITALAALITLVEPRPDAMPETASPLLLAE